MLSSHLVIPDAHIRPGCQSEHIEALSQWIVRNKPKKIIVIGDWWDIGSLSPHSGCVATGGGGAGKALEGKRLRRDLQSGLDAIDCLMFPIEYENKKHRRAGRSFLQYRPELYFIEGNHEERLRRIAEICPQLETFVGIDDIREPLIKHGFHFQRFLDPIEIDGIFYSHYFANKKGGAIGVRQSASVLNASAIWGHTHSVGYELTQGLDGRTVTRICAGTFKHPSDLRPHEQSGVFHLTSVARGEFSMSYIRTSDLLKSSEKHGRRCGTMEVIDDFS